MEKFYGVYEKKQGNGERSDNEWHHVKVLPEAKGDENSPLIWLNDAGVSWPLTIDIDCDKDGDRVASFIVGEKCPYFQQGYTRCDAITIDDHLVLLGPNGSKFHRVEDLPSKVLSRALGGHSLNDRKIEIGKSDTIHNISVSVMYLSPDKVDWTDLAYLTAIPSSSHKNRVEGDADSIMPVVLALTESETDPVKQNDDSIADILTRLQPKEITNCRINGGADLFEFSNANDGIHIESSTVLNNLKHAITVFTNVWSESSAVVIVKRGSYGMAVMASSFATRIDAPLLFFEMGNAHSPLNQVLAQAIGRLGQSKIYIFGDNDLPDGLLSVGDHVVVEHLQSPNDVIAHMISNGMKIDYIAVINPNDRNNGLSRKISLTAPIYAAHRQGIVVPVPGLPINADSASSNNRLKKVIPYLKNNIYSQFTGGEQNQLPEYLALFGSFDVMPVWQTTSMLNNSKQDIAVTDLKYGRLNTEDKHGFLHFAVGRIFCDSICGASLLAARTITYELLKDGCWENNVIECGKWGYPEVRSLIENMGYNKSQHLSKEDIENKTSIEAAILLHKDHGAPTGLSHAMTIHTKALYSPSVFLTSGCHAAGIDERNPNLASRMLSRGAIAYIGAPRAHSAPNTLMEVGVINSMLYEGKSVGQAMRAALNKGYVDLIEGGAMINYCLENEMLLGDPAVKITTPRTRGVEEPQMVTASLKEDDNNIVQVIGPEKWTKVPVHRDQLSEWKYEGDLYTYAAPCAVPQTHWCSGGYNNEDLYYFVSLQLHKTNSEGQELKGIEIIEADEIIYNEDDGECTTTTTTMPEDLKSWWPTKKYYIHEQYGDEKNEVDVYWRVRMLYFDMPTGKLKRQLKTASFQLVY